MKQVQRITIFVFMFSMMLLPAVSTAAELKAQRDYTLQKNEVVEGDMYIAAQTNVVAGTVKGDLAVAGANVLITGSVEQDLLAAGGTVEILGEVGDDIRVAGGTITIGKTVGGDVVVAGGVVHIISGALVEGDVLVAGGQVIIDGAVKGSVKALAGEITINGMVGKDVSVQSDKRFIIGRDAKIDGNLWYRSANAVEIAEGAVIRGETKFEKIERPVRADERARAAMAGAVGVMALIKLLIILTATIVGVLLFKKVAHALVKTTADNFGRELVRGFVILVVIPAAILFAMVSVIGIGLGAAGALVYILAILVAKVLTGIFLGALLVKLIKKSKEYEVNWQTASIGVVALELIWLVPILGWVFGFVLFLASLGSISLMVYQKAWLKK